MSRWPSVRFDDVLTQVSRAVPVEPAETYTFTGVRSFGGGCFVAGDRSGDETRYQKLLKLEANDFVFPKLMAWEGAFAVVPEAMGGTYVSPEFCTFRTDSERLDTRFLAHYFRWPDAWALVAGNSPGTNVRRRRLYPEPFLKKTIPLPPIDEQHRIASFLDSVVARQGAVEVLLTRQQQLMAAYVASMASQGGNIRRVGELVTQVRRPVLVEPQARYRLVGIRSAGQGLFTKQEIAGSETTAKTFCRIEEGDFIYSRLFAWQGSFALASREFDGCVASSEFPMFRIDQAIVLPDYLRAWFRRPQTWRQVEARSSGSTPQSRNRLREDRFLELEIAVPELEKQRKVAGALLAADKFQDLRTGTWSRVRALSRAAIHRTFSVAGD